MLGLSSLTAQRDLGVAPTESGGILIPEQAAFDVRYCRLELEVNPADKRIDGSLTITSEIVSPTRYLVLDLDSHLEVSNVTWINGQPLSFSRREGRLWIEFPQTRQPGSREKVKIFYGGKPRAAARPPWVGGFIWSATASGQPWIGVACQVDGADLWWPVKDHPSDEPESMDLIIRVPAGLVVAANGTLHSVVEDAQGVEYRWQIRQPINTYNVSLNIAPYRTIKEIYQSIDGTRFPLQLYVLPEHEQAGRNFLIPQMRAHLRFHEELLGPYPFRSEKYGVAETPYLGMEHQTIIAYGSDFSKSEYGFDWLHFHELSHEWWGNLVSAYDWKDHWLHEGFASYMSALYVEKLHGPARLQEYMLGLRPRLRNKMAVAPRVTQTTRQKYFVPPDYTETDGDVNFKGAWFLHTLRYAIGEKAFFEVLRRFAYPTPEAASATDGSQCRFVSTEDLIGLTNEITGQQLDWFFDTYLRQPELPVLHAKEGAGQLSVRWKVPQGYRFELPVPVRVGEKTVLLEPGESLALPEGSNWEVDPDGWILRAGD